MACVHISWLFMLWLIGFAKKKRRTFLRMVAAKQANFRSTRRMHGKQKHVGTKWLIFTLYMFRTGVQRHEEKRPGNKQKWKNTILKEFFDDENIDLVQCFNLIICMAWVMRPWNDSVTFSSYVAIHIHLDMLKPKKITSWMVGVGYKIKYLSLPRIFSSYKR